MDMPPPSRDFYIQIRRGLLAKIASVDKRDLSKLPHEYRDILLEQRRSDMQMVAWIEKQCGIDPKRRKEKQRQRKGGTG